MKSPKSVILRHNCAVGSFRARVTHGAWDDEARRAFSWGHCHAFALALHEATGWDIWEGYYEDPEEVDCIDPDFPPELDEWSGEVACGVPGHFACRRPDGVLADVCGAFRDGDLNPLTTEYGPASWYRSSPKRIRFLVECDIYRELEALEAARSIVPVYLEAT